MDKEEHYRSDVRPPPLPPARQAAEPHLPPEPPRPLFHGESSSGECEPGISAEEGVAITTKDFEWLGDGRPRPASTPRPEEVEFELARLKPEEPGERIGPYKLLQQLGEGGFGIVWMAEQEHPVRRRVALKIIKMGMDTREVVARFEQERQALALMDHPNIAKVFDAGATPFGRPYFVMELVRGIRITEYCDQLNLDTVQRLQLFVVLCRAVQHAHLKGIIHRDLKSSNILVTLKDGDPVPMIIDFGVAKATQQRLTELTLCTEIEQMVGTPAYMSPEQAEMSGLDIDSRTDVYALGVLLYELLTGRTPFDPTELMKLSREGIRRVIREQEPPRPSLALSTLGGGVINTVAMHRRIESGKLLSLLRGDLDWIVMKTIEKDRTRRYETANDLAADIERHLAHEPIRARPPSRLYRLRRFIRRHRVGFYSGVLIAAALIIGTSVSVSQAIRANAALAELEKMAGPLGAQARELVLSGNFDQAIETLGTAIKLQPKAIEFHFSRAALLKIQFRFDEAAEDYRRILELDPENVSTRVNRALCLRLAGVPRGGTGGLPPAALAELYASLVAEGRPAAERMKLARALGKENEIRRAYWLELLRSLPNASAIPLEERLKSGESTLLELDLRGTKITDLSPLAGMPLRSLDLSGCTGVVDIKALSNMPLHILNLEKTGVTTVEPVGTMREIEELNLARTFVTDVAPLSSLPIRKLLLAHTRVSDLKPLRNMPLEYLDIASTSVSSLEPLKKLPLKILDCSSTPIGDYSPLADLPLEVLSLQGAPVGDLGFVSRMPLRALFLTDAIGVRGLHTLAEIPTLETLALPADTHLLPVEEIDAIESLRHQRKLLRVSASTAGSKLDTTEATDVFWRKWDAMMKWWKPLRDAGISIEAKRLANETWSLIIRDQPIRDLSVFSGAQISRLELTGCGQVSDLKPLEGLPLTFLGIVNTAVADLTPLKSMLLEELWMAGTPITDLEPLRGMPLRLLHFDHCSHPLDVSPLVESPGLASVVLPESAYNVETLQQLTKLNWLSYTFDFKTNRPATGALAFWKEFHDLRWLHNLRAAGLKLTADQVSDGTWRVVLTDSSFSDTHALEGAHISELVLRGSNVTDLQPLAGLKLRRLRLDGTPCTEVSPLAAMASLESLILPKGATDFRSLQSLRSIKRIGFNPNAQGQPEFEAEEFWRKAADDAR